MSEENLLSMDEGALRKLLEATLDLAERRQIRSAIRELRRQELERDEEALASKRFRSERASQRRENKENWLRSQRLEEEQQKSLALLSGKLDAITDVEELTALLRGAAEYEERKLIRAAIRKLRATEIEAAASAGRAPGGRRGECEPLESVAGGSATELEERGRIRAQIRELRGEQRREPPRPGAQDLASGNLLLLDPLRPPCPPRSASEPEPPQRAPACGSRSPESPPAAERPRQPPWPEERAGQGDGESCGRPEAGGSEEPSRGGAEQEEAPAGDGCQAEETRRRLPSSGSRSSQALVCVESPAAEKQASTASKPPRAAPARDVPGTPARQDTRHGAPTFSPLPAHGTEPVREQPFQRASSVRERARRFTADAPAPPGPCSQRWDGPAPGARLLQPQQLLRSQSARGPQEAGARRAGDLPSGARCGAQEASGGPGASSLEAETAIARPPARSPACPKEEGRSVGRSLPGQSQGGRRAAPPRGPVENAAEGSSAGPEEPGARHAASPPSRPARPQPPAQASAPEPDPMKTLVTIEIKDGRAQPLGSRLVGAPGSQRAELTLGPRSSPVRISASPGGVGSASSARKVEAEPAPAEPPRAPVLELELPNGMAKAQAQARAPEKSKLSAEELSRIEEEDVLDKMLDQTSDFEERRLIRAAMRDLRQRKREQREKERDQRLQEMKSQAAAGRAGHATETTTQQSAQSADGSAHHTLTKTEHLLHSNDGTKTSRLTTVESSYVKRSENGSTFVQTKSSYSSSSSSKKVGSIFDREDDSGARQGSLAALERRQAEKKKELLKAQSLPKTSAMQARKAMIEKLEKESGSPLNPAVQRVAVQRSSSFGVPNANSIKQMLLDWCRAKTRGYEHVDIQNFSSSWSDGMAFCALVHNFFPEAFDYAQLAPQNRRHNFEVAFSTAERHADCPQLLDVEDMVRMREPDWKCVYTYTQEFYRCLVQKGLVKTKKS